MDKKRSTSADKSKDKDVSSQKSDKGFKDKVKDEKESKKLLLLNQKQHRFFWNFVKTIIFCQLPIDLSLIRC